MKVYMDFTLSRSKSPQYAPWSRARTRTLKNCLYLSLEYLMISALERRFGPCNWQLVEYTHGDFLPIIIQQLLPDMIILISFPTFHIMKIQIDSIRSEQDLSNEFN